MTDKLEFQPNEDAWAYLLENLSRSNIQIAMVVTGGGTGVISRCLRRSGASLNFVEAVVPYSRTATQEYLGFKPTQGYASQDTAKALAQTAQQRAASLSDKSRQALGIALTATLPTSFNISDPKPAQNCCIHVASHGLDFSRGWSLCFTGQANDRETSESIAEQMFLIAIHDSLQESGVTIDSDPFLPLNSAGLTITVTHGAKP